MKIGILTFHAQLNYGGVLQCLALQTALAKMGHDVIVIDKWLDRRICIWNIYAAEDLRRWIKFALGLWLVDGFAGLLRTIKTKRFIRERLNLSAYSFKDWMDAPSDLGVDMIIVGSDQVWRCLDGMDPRPYLLCNAPDVEAISYAASFGMSSLPSEMEDLYRSKLSAFKAISCRELEGVGICRRLGLDCEHVVDPTLLNADFCNDQCMIKRNEMVCYFLSEDIESHWKAITEFAKNKKCAVKIFTNNSTMAFPTSIKGMRTFLRKFVRQFSRQVRVCGSAGPDDFSAAFATARWVVSDSFHALMFAIQNKCNVQILAPRSPMRKAMFARIDEIAIHAHGRLVADSLQDALDYFDCNNEIAFDYAWFETRRRESLNWLSSAIQK